MLLQEAIGNEKRPLSWVVGEQKPIPQTPPVSHRDTLRDQRMRAKELRNPFHIK